MESLSERELLISGIALYWAEGFKTLHERRLGFCNSDPNMIRFYLYWLQRALHVNSSEVVARVTLNVSHKHRVEEVEEYWSKLTGIPLEQFTKPFYQNSQWKKRYNTDTYYGVLRIHVKNSLNDLLRMRGWIQGLARVAQSVRAQHS